MRENIILVMRSFRQDVFAFLNTIAPQKPNPVAIGPCISLTIIFPFWPHVFASDTNNILLYSDGITNGVLVSCSVSSKSLMIYSKSLIKILYAQIEIFLLHVKKKKQQQLFLVSCRYYRKNIIIFIFCWRRSRIDPRRQRLTYILPSWKKRFLKFPSYCT